MVVDGGCCIINYAFADTTRDLSPCLLRCCSACCSLSRLLAGFATRRRRPRVSDTVQMQRFHGTHNSLPSLSRACPVFTLDGDQPRRRRLLANASSSFLVTSFHHHTYPAVLLTHCVWPSHLTSGRDIFLLSYLYLDLGPQLSFLPLPLSISQARYTTPTHSRPL